jgi:5-(carboxyamino)imidazole ribonucleotide synthase
VSENFHQDGQLILSLVTDPHPLQHMAEEIVKKILIDLDYIGCIAVEFFVKDGELLVNEVAPRVHNSGHWTTDGANVSQFANHLQAVSGKRVMQPTLKGPVAMVNCIGSIPTAEASTQVPCCTLYDYKKSPKPKRKLGHMNIIGDASAQPDFYRHVASALELIGEKRLAERVLSRV